MKQKDKQLITNAQLNNKVYQELYQRYYGKVYNYFWYRLGYNKEISEDLAQETFLKAFKKFDKYHDEGYSYLTYLLCIAHNLLVNYLRKRKIIIVDITKIKEIPAEIKQYLKDDIDAQELWYNVEQLPFVERDTILLRYRKELKIEEIAIILNKSKNAVHLILSRARKRLRRKFVEEPKLQKLSKLKGRPKK